MTTSLSRRLAPLVLCVSAALGLAPAPAHAAPAAELTVSGLDTSVGQVQFFLAGRGLPAGTSLTSGVTVEADGIALPARVEALQVATPGAPARGVVLVLDASGSMAGTAISAARAAATDYSTALPADVRLGLVTVSTKAKQALAPTTDRAAFAGTVGKVEAGGDTALYDGIRQAAAALTVGGANYDERRVVVLSDGADTTSKTKAADAAKDLADAHATLDVVAYGAQAGGAEVRALAEGTGGHLYPAADSAALRTIFREMSGALTAPVMVTATVPPKLSGKTTHLRVAVPGGTSTEAQVAFRVDPAAAAATAPQATAEVATGPRWMIWAGAGAVALGLLVGILLAAVGGSPMRRRIRQVERFTTDRLPQRLHRERAGKTVLRAALAVSERAVSARGKRITTQVALERAGMAMRPAEWLLLRVVVTFVLAALLMMLFGPVAGILIGGPVGWFLTRTYRNMRTKRRARKFAELLPEALHLVVGALRSGFSLPQAVDAVGREGPEPVNTEFARALTETRLGGELEEALERAAERNDSRDLAWLVMAIRIQREVGGNLSEVLETAVETMRERARLARHVRGLSAEGRLSAYVLAGMPVALALFMFVTRREYISPLYTEPLGMGMLGGAVMIVGLGILWMKKLIKVEV